MEELSLHILDIVENSIAAGATCVQITIREDLPADRLEIEIADDGRGMDAETLQKALDPFFTTKSVRRVGLGLSLLREAARAAGGDITLQSEVGKGTKLCATFQLSHVDRQPVGDMAGTMTTLIVGHPEIRFVYRHRKNGKTYELDSERLKAEGEVRTMSALERMQWVRKNWPEIP